MEDITKESIELIKKDLSIESETSADSDEALLEFIAVRVRELMQEDIGLLLSYLYRLDVKESKVDYILNKQSVIAPDLGIAKLIFDRQKQRVQTKKIYKQGDMIKGWEF